MVKRKTKTELISRDNAFALKLVFYVLLGSLWLKVYSGHNIMVPIPVGLVVGMVFASHEHFRTDRKIQYTALILAALIGFWAPFGLYIKF